MDPKRDEAKQFLTGFEERLRESLRLSEQAAEGKAITEQIEQIRAHAREDEKKKHLKFSEAAFLNHWVAPALFEQLRVVGLDDSEAKAALLAESHSSLKKISGGPAARPEAFPFEKKMGVPAGDIYDRWVGRSGGQPFTQPYPDLAVRHPSYRIVFEGKYFRSGSLKYAERQLVAAIHESLFYLGVPEIKARDREWGYAYACLVAFDASPDATLLTAWNNLKGTRSKFWDWANLHVILIGAHKITG
jgi:hypothetical protein